MTSLSDIEAYIDSNASLLIDQLAKAVAIRSVSSDPLQRPACVEMGRHIEALLQSIGCQTQSVDLGVHQGLPLPPIVLGTLGTDAKKPTVALYGHYDVQPADVADGWHTDPWTLTEVEGKLYGRGSTDDKGPLLCWIWAIEAFQKTGRELPVNLKFCFEGMEESGSVGLEGFVEKEAKGFFGDVDYFCVSDNYWLGDKKPCVTYGLRGMAYFFVEIEGPKQDLHSGLFGGVVHEPMVELMYLMGSKLVDPISGEILIPGVQDSVRKVDENEQKLYETIDFDTEEFRKVVGAGKLLKEGKVQVLQHRWRFPSLSIHGVEGAFSGVGCKTVIPRKVIGKFSLRLVPDQDPQQIEKLVQDYLTAEFAKLQSPNKLKISLAHGARAWLSPTDHPNYEAARKAVKAAYDIDPDLTREGGSIPIVLTFQEATGKNVLLLPIGCADDGAHSQNEKINKQNYIKGCKLLAHYFVEISKAGKVQ